MLKQCCEKKIPYLLSLDKDGGPLDDFKDDPNFRAKYTDAELQELIQFKVKEMADTDRVSSDVSSSNCNTLFRFATVSLSVVSAPSRGVVAWILLATSMLNFSVNSLHFIVRSLLLCQKQPTHKLRMIQFDLGGDKVRAFGTVLGGQKANYWQSVFYKMHGVMRAHGIADIENPLNDEDASTFKPRALVDSTYVWWLKLIQQRRTAVQLFRVLEILGLGVAILLLFVALFAPGGADLMGIFAAISKIVNFAVLSITLSAEYQRRFKPEVIDMEVSFDFVKNSFKVGNATTTKQLCCTCSMPNTVGLSLIANPKFRAHATIVEDEFKSFIRLQLQKQNMGELLIDDAQFDVEIKTRQAGYNDEESRFGQALADLNMGAWKSLTTESRSDQAPLVGAGHQTGYNSAS